MHLVTSKYYVLEENIIYGKEYYFNRNDAYVFHEKADTIIV